MEPISKNVVNGKVNEIASNKIQIGRRSMKFSYLFLAGIVLVGGLSHSFEGYASDVNFANTCSAEVKSEINRGITLLHSFEYPETTTIFRKVISNEPSCAIAYWGAAMSIWHPLWAPPSKNNLITGAQLLTKTDGLSVSKREQEYIAALKVFFSSTDVSTNRARAVDYSKAMNLLYERYRDRDLDATVFYALSLLGSADPRDKTYGNQYKSGALLKFAQQSQPTHPGILHYIIHSYDFPGLAHLAFEDAKNYASAAPDSSHAQHMPSHIFTRLGHWERSLASNHDSTRSAATYTKQVHLDGHYDEGLHSMDYLLYAMLQTGRDAEALNLLNRLEEMGKTNTENFKVAFTYAASWARYTLERRAWDQASTIELVRANDFPWKDFPWAESIHHFARGLGAARSGNIGKANKDLARIRQLYNSLSENAPLYWRVEVKVQADIVASWIMLKSNDTEQALKLASIAAENEDAVDKHPVTPGEVIPARELYADMLLEVMKYPEALKQYQAVLKVSPNRLNALLGAANSAEKSGNKNLANSYRTIVQNQTKFGSRKFSAL
jgi:tetratricopeptide (TPR) repeat protein